MTNPNWTFAHDLDTVVSAVDSDWEKMRGARVLMTGGTGFIGRWMLEAWRIADQRMNLASEIVVVSRSPAAFADKAPHLANYKGIRLIEGDVSRPIFAEGAFTHVIHAATDASAHLNEHDPRRMFDTVIDGTRHALDFAVAKRVKPFFYLSSGAVYGSQPWEVEHVAETWRGGPDCQDPRAAYAEGKRAAEMRCAIYAKQFGLKIVTARIFALLGPLLSLDIHFAAGNFIRDAMAGRVVQVDGAGLAVRSYLYASDLTTWLWRMFLSGEPGSIFNAGSQEAVSIAELAERVARLIGNGEFVVLGKPDPGWNPGRYVPSTKLAESQLGLTATIDLDEAIRRTAIWNGWKR